jgi:hypothetical protein
MGYPAHGHSEVSELVEPFLEEENTEAVYFVRILFRKAPELLINT